MKHLWSMRDPTFKSYGEWALQVWPSGTSLSDELKSKRSNPKRMKKPGQCVAVLPSLTLDWMKHQIDGERVWDICMDHVKHHLGISSLNARYFTSDKASYMDTGFTALKTSFHNMEWVRCLSHYHMGRWPANLRLWVFRRYANDALFSYIVALSFACVNSFEQIVHACRAQNAFICDSTNGRKAAKGQYKGESRLILWFKLNMREISHMRTSVIWHSHQQCSSWGLLFVWWFCVCKHTHSWSETRARKEKWKLVLTWERRRIDQFLDGVLGGDLIKMTRK